MKLVNYLPVMDYWAGYQMREKRYEKGIIEQGIFLRSFTEGIDQISNLLKREEADCQWQRKVQKGNIRPENGIDIGHKEIVILVIAQEADVE